MFKDIVLAVTPSKVCECAADKAISFAQRFEANLYMVHVCGLEQGWGVMRQLIPSGETDRIAEQLEAYYREKLKGVDRCQIKVVPGSPHVEILRLARKVNSDLIVMGPHTKDYEDTRARTWGMTGSCLERVSQKARCPVMIVAQESPYGEQSFFNVLVATDLSREAECSVGYAAQMARQYKAHLHIVFVLELSPGQELPPQKEIEKTLRLCEEKMERLYADRLQGLPQCSFHTCEGDPALEILKCARRVKADLILMAHHSKEKDPEAAYLGSTVATVALNAMCPTMSINRHFDMRCALY
jgi:nucleotide-binding universal stress UspA family protein